MNAATAIRPNFKAEWNDKDFKRAKAAIRKHFTFKPVLTDTGYKTFYTYADFDNFAGLAYTSSSSYAMLTPCNGMYLLFPEDKKYHFEFFGIDKDGNVWAELWDKDENEKYIKL